MASTTVGAPPRPNRPDAHEAQQRRPVSLHRGPADRVYFVLGPQPVRQRPDDRRDLRPGRARLHDGLRDHRAHQLRPRRRVHGRRLRVAVRAHQRPRPDGLGRPASTQIVFVLVDRRSPSTMPSIGLLGVDDRAVRLPAAAQRAAPRPADHRDRRVVHPAEPHPDHLRTVAGEHAPVIPPTAQVEIGGDQHRLGQHLHHRRRHRPDDRPAAVRVSRTRLGRAMRSTAPGPRGRRS